MNERRDQVILSMASVHWRKVARIIAASSQALRDADLETSEDQIAQRLKALVAAGRLERQGDLDLWRYSEVRLPQSN